MPAQNEDMIRRQDEEHQRVVRAEPYHDSYNCPKCWCHWLLNEIDQLRGKPVKE